MKHISQAIAEWLERKDFTPSQIKKIKKGYQNPPQTLKIKPRAFKNR